MMPAVEHALDTRDNAPAKSWAQEESPAMCAVGGSFIAVVVLDNDVQGNSKQ